MRLTGILLPLTLAASVLPARAEECAAFKWPMVREIALFKAADAAALGSGSEVTAFPEDAVRVRLVPFAVSKLPVEPEKQPKVATNKAGWVKLPAPAAGAYQVSLSARGWIDVVQGEARVASTEFSSDRDCPLIHKSVRFILKAEPVVLQISDVEGDEVVFSILPVAETAPK